MIDTNLAGAPEDTRFEFEVDYVATGRSLLLFELVLDKEYLDAQVARAAPALTL